MNEVLSMKKDIEIFIKKYCKLNGISQKELSEITKIPLSTIKSYVNSKFNPTTENIKKLENTLKLDLKFLLLDKEVFNLNTVEGIQNILEKYLYEFSESSEEIIDNTEKIIISILKDIELKEFTAEKKAKIELNDFKKYLKTKPIPKYMRITPKGKEIFSEESKKVNIIRELENVHDELLNLKEKIEYLLDILKLKKSNEENTPANEDNPE